jgi:hypothetical protein
MSCVCMLLITRRNEAYIGEFKKQMMKDLNVCNLSNMAEESNWRNYLEELIHCDIEDRQCIFHKLGQKSNITLQ